jgi:hypothetical protein
MVGELGIFLSFLQEGSVLVVRVNQPLRRKNATIGFQENRHFCLKAAKSPKFVFISIDPWCSAFLLLLSPLCDVGEQRTMDEPEKATFYFGKNMYGWATFGRLFHI